jgi:hypothetical protein
MIEHAHSLTHPRHGNAVIERGGSSRGVPLAGNGPGRLAAGHRMHNIKISAAEALVKPR